MKVIASIVLIGLVMAGPALAQGRCGQTRDLRLVNGRIHTLDARNTIVSEVTIQDGKFTPWAVRAGTSGISTPARAPSTSGAALSSRV
jgi:hypothetical protein